MHDSAAFRLTTDSAGLAWLSFDQPDSTTNILTAAALDALDAQLDEIIRLAPAGLIVQSAKHNGFIAGADVKDFAKAPGIAMVEAHIQRVHALFERIETLPCPSVALIHGYCLGGGLELALACHYRVCSDASTTRLGFPEVRLGIFPGYGGTVRSTRLLGALPALQMMLSGRSLDARKAQRIGLVDRVVPQRHLQAAARDVLHRRPPVRTAPWAERMASLAPLRPLVGVVLRRALSRKLREDHYPAAFALLRHWQRHAGSAHAMYRSEASEVAGLLHTRSAQNLIRVFMLQERLKRGGDREAFAVERVHVVGAGLMGGDIAAWCALNGLRVSLQDRGPAQLSAALQRANQLFARRIKDPYARQAALDRLIPDHPGHGVRDADLVIEAIYEDADAKRALHQALERQMRGDALLASNTSSIPLETLSRGLRRPHRLVGLHFFNPVARMPLLEVVRDRHTDPQALRQAGAFARHIDKLPLEVRSSPGFLVNRILMPYLLEAVALLESGLAAATIDAEATAFGMPVGPVELADTVGLDICLAVAEKMAGPLHTTVPRTLRSLVAAGRLGRKTGQGFYTWRKGRAVHKRASARGASDIGERLILRLINEAVACLREGVVEDPDLLDAGVVFGTGFAPFLGGPLHYARETGITALQGRLNELETRYGAQFHPDPGWSELT